MAERSLIAATLGLSSPWRISGIDFSDEEKRMDIYVEFAHGGPLLCPHCGASARLGETAREVWHHANFFCHAAYLHVRVPSLLCTADCGVSKVPLPWARQDSCFALLVQGTAHTFPPL